MKFEFDMSSVSSVAVKVQVDGHAETGGCVFVYVCVYVCVCREAPIDRHVVDMKRQRREREERGKRQRREREETETRERRDRDMR